PVFSPDGKLVALTNLEGIRLWDVESGEERWHAPTTADQLFEAIQFSPDGRLMATGQPRQVRLWQAADGRELFASPADRQRVQFIGLSADGRTVTTASRTEHPVPPGSPVMVGRFSLRTWDGGTGKALSSLSEKNDWLPQLGDLSADGQTLAEWAP